MQLNKPWFLVFMLSFTIGMIGFQATSLAGQTKTDSGPELLKPGQSATYDDLEVTLLSLSKTSEYANGPKPGQGYAVLRFRVKNRGKEEDSARIFSDLQWWSSKEDKRNGYERTTGVQLNNP